MPDAFPIVGLTAGRTQDGRSQIDGAACLVHGDRAWAVAEERLTRRKHAGGCENALAALLSASGLSMAEIGLFVLSTCGEELPEQGAAAWLRTDGRWALQDMGVRSDRIVWNPSHHLSHALHAAHAVNAEDALVCVFDREGVDGERASYFLARGGELKSLRQDKISRPGGGIGLAYAHVTQALGWSGDAEAGKTMALAAYGRTAALPPVFVAFDPLTGRMAAMEVPISPPVTFRERADLAAAIQTQLEEVVVAAVRHWDERVNFHTICVAGGVGTNCRLLGALGGAFPEKTVRAPYAPSDTGQAIGNAIFGCRLSGIPVPLLLRSPFLGATEINDGAEAARLLGRPGVSGDAACDMVAALLADGAIIGVCVGRSEFGPRALGARSLLCKADAAEPVRRLNASVKRREWFRPFGVIAQADDIARLSPRSAHSCFMEMTDIGRREEWKEISAALHIDGSCRFQVALPSNPVAPILERIRRREGCAFLVNTSLNRAGEPLVETTIDAIGFFQSTDIDAMLIGDQLFLR